jgi:purine-cytosine permease-like protein
MSHQQTRHGTGSGEKFLTYAGIAGIAVAVLLTVAVAALTVLPALVPSGAVLGTALFTLLLAGAAVGVRRLHRSRGREMDVDPDWH